MRKKLAVLLITLLLLASVLPAVLAADFPGYVYDEAGILTEAQRSALSERAEEISSRYQSGVYIAIVSDMQDYDFANIEEFAQAVYESNSYGWPGTGNGILLVLSMGGRDYDLDAKGDFANYAYTDYGKSVLADSFIDDFRYNDWYTGFCDYLDGCEGLMKRAADGEPLDNYYSGYENDYSTRSSSGNGYLIFAVFAGLMSALISCSIMKGKLKSVRKAGEAGWYVAENGVSFAVQDDVFTHTTQVRQRIEREASRSGGGGGTHVNSGGHSHSSGKF